MLYQFACCNIFNAVQEIKELWMEYEANSSVEAKVVKDFDKVIYVQITYVKLEISYCAQGS